MLPELADAHADEWNGWLSRQAEAAGMLSGWRWRLRHGGLREEEGVKEAKGGAAA